MLYPRNQPHPKSQIFEISWYKLKLKIWSYLNLYRGFRDFRFGGFRGAAFSVESVMRALFLQLEEMTSKLVTAE